MNITDRFPPVPDGLMARMRHRAHRAKITERGLLLLDAITIAVMFLGTFYIRFWSGVFSTYLHSRIEAHYLIALPVVMLIQIVCLWFLGAYSIRRPSGYPAQLIMVLHSAVLTPMLFLALVFWYRAWLFSRWVIVLYSVGLVFVLPLLRTAFYRVVCQLRRRGHDLVPLMAVCPQDQAGAVRSMIEENPELGFRLVDVTAIEEAAGEEHPALYTMLGKSDARAIYLSVYSEPYVELVVDLVEQSKQEELTAHIHPNMYTLLRPHARWRVIDDGIWFTLERGGWDRLYQTAKRYMDLIIAAGVLILSLPLQALIATLIRWEGPGAIIFSQQRAGLNGRSFTIYKFRSMQVDAEKHLEEVLDIDALAQPVFKVDNDPRVTRIGRVLRRLSLDELPQLWNVLKGEMSLVGPRPEEFWMTERYDRDTRQRLRIKPGITGYQQICARGADDMRVRLNHDLYYIDHQSLFFDLYILAQTVWVVLWGKGRT